MSYLSKLRAHAWFILINAFLGTLISSYYFTYLPEFPSETIAQVFIVSGSLSQIALLSFLLGCVFIPILILPKSLRNSLQALIAGCGLGILIIDTMVFAQYRFHLNMAVLDMIFSGQIVSFPIETWLSVTVVGIAILSFQFILIRHLEKAPSYTQHGWGRRFSVTVFAALLIIFMHKSMCANSAVDKLFLTAETLAVSIAANTESTV